MQITKLLAVLIWHRHNLQMVHWNVVGKHFRDVHLACDGYIDTTTDNIDKVAEFIKSMNLDEPIPTLVDVTKMIESDDTQHAMVQFQKMESKESWKILLAIFEELIEEFDRVYDTLPKDLQSEVDSMVYYYRIEGLYKIKATLSEVDDEE